MNITCHRCKTISFVSFDEYTKTKGRCPVCDKKPLSYESRFFGLVREYDEGHAVPWYVGLAYRDYAYRTTVCAVIPLNWIVATFRWLYFELKCSDVLVWMSKRSRRGDDA